MQDADRRSTTGEAKKMTDSDPRNLIGVHILGGGESESKATEIDATSMLNALSLRRTWPTTNLPLDQLKSPEWSSGLDPIFQKKYSAFLEGNLTVYNTRVSLSNVRPGFYLHQRSGGFDYQCDEPPQDVVDDLAKAIREGHRPTLYLYGNVNTADPVRYLCPDDVASYRAYLSLRIEKVPATILSTHRRTWEESAIGLRCYRIGDRNPAHIHSVEVFNPEKLPAFISDAALSTDFEQHIPLLRSAIAQAKAAIKNFHAGPASALHYHHTLHSALARLDDTLYSILLLAREGLWYQAVPLVRVLYETSLNFYLDWLAPETMHPFLALSAVLTDAQVKQLIEEKTPKSEVRASKQAREALQRALDRTFSLVRSVQQKARLSPLGNAFYENMYSFLSAVAHQDFEVVANYAHTLQREERPEFENDTILSLIRCADFVVATVVTRVLADVGNAQEDSD